jgi:hypothetical protein
MEDILEEASSFYATLFSDKLTNTEKGKADPFLKKNVKKKLSFAQKKYCDAPINVDELGNALRKLPSQKAPGIDGLRAEIFKKFWHELKNDFKEVLD